MDQKKLEQVRMDTEAVQKMLMKGMTEFEAEKEATKGEENETAAK